MRVTFVLPPPAGDVFTTSSASQIVGQRVRLTGIEGDAVITKAKVSDDGEMMLLQVDTFRDQPEPPWVPIGTTSEGFTVYALPPDRPL